jgi:CRP-like cAMP-binding protein
VVSNLDLFADFNISKAKEFLTIVEEEDFKRGEKIIEKGTQGNKFYIILTGNIRVEGTSTGVSKTYGTYEYFGETSLITGEPRSADVVAETDVVALTVEKNSFLNFIRGSSIEKSLLKLARIRESNSWNLLSKSKLFQSMTSTQKTQLETILTETAAIENTPLLTENKPPEAAYIINSGEVKLKRSGETLRVLGSGDFVGEIFSIQKSAPSPFSAVVTKKAELFRIKPEDLTRFIKKNPGIYMRLMTDIAELLS